MKNATLRKASDLLPERSPETEKDLRLLYELLPNLSDEGIVAVYFRFWERLLIEDIARILGLSWSETNKLIDDSIKELRNGFLSNRLSTRLIAA